MRGRAVTSSSFDCAMMLSTMLGNMRVCRLVGPFSRKVFKEQQRSVTLFYFWPTAVGCRNCLDKKMT